MSQKAQSRGETSSAGLPSSETAVSDVLRDFDRWALFIDIDGTLIDLASTPDAIVVPPELPAMLEAVSTRFGGALALVTGRALLYADSLFAPYVFPIAGLHGAERRMANGKVDRVEVTAEFNRLKQALIAETAGWNGVLIEDKGAAVAGHYRQAPDRRSDLEALMERAAASAGDGFKLQHGKMVIELRPAGASKGEALAAFMHEQPFAGRLPVAVGDDLTDEAMFRTANSLGGHSIHIGDTILADGTTTQAKALLSSVREFRNVLANLVR